MPGMQPPSSPTPSAAVVEPALAAQDAYLSEDLLSSPPQAGGSSSSHKERRQPSITPRKFRRFFTPRVSASFPTPARRALRDLTARAINHAQASSATAATPFGSASFGFNSSPLAAATVRRAGNENELDEDGDGQQDELPQAPSRPAKRRKTGHQTPETSPMRPSTTKYLDAITPKPPARIRDFTPTLLSPLDSSPVPAMTDVDDPMSEDDEHASGNAEPEVTFADPPAKLKPIVRFAERGLAGQTLQRETSCQLRGVHTRRPAADWRIDTANFYTSKDDVHVCVSHDTPSERCIPFCAAAGNTSGMVAVGDEEGLVRLLDSSRDSKDGFDFVNLSVVAHGNAVIDVAFSYDDSLLATASGDQTGRVIDMATQAPISILDQHTASLKQVRFQPGRGEGNVLATSGRDGSIKIWDLRCHGGPAQEFTVEGYSRGLRYSLPQPRKINSGCVVNSIYDAHARMTRQTRQTRKSLLAAAAAEVTTRWEEPSRVGEVSVTAIQFMPAGKEHLLLSACEADASIKLWDIRNIHTSRQKASSTPLSYTAVPESHSQWRPFGMSSLSLSTDGERLFGLCKDNTVYAYSTSHLMLGSAPELSAKAPDHPRRRNGIVQEGLGPLYGFRHEKFHATSFYVKTAVRPAKDGRPEMLAVGSSDGTPILFPTDERYFMGVGDMLDNSMQAAAADQEQATVPLFSSTARTVGSRSNSPAPRRPGGLFRTNSMSSLQGGSSGRLVDTVPIVRNGTPLVRGHEPREVGAVCWTNEGSLVTVGDDQYIRCWREGGEFEEGVAARDLRRGGEREGRRWMAGWADVGEDWDGDDDDDDGDDWIID